MVSSGMLRHVALVRTDVSEELSASFISVTRIDELGTTLAVTSNRSTALRTSNLTLEGTQLKSHHIVLNLVLRPTVPAMTG
jgi:hypothetical protein